MASNTLSNVVRLTLVPAKVRAAPVDLDNLDVVAVLEELLADARKGLVRGLAFAAILRGRKFLVDCAGTACADPTLTRGVLCALDDELQRMVSDQFDRSDD